MLSYNKRADFRSRKGYGAAKGGMDVKKLFALILLIALVGTLSACGNEEALFCRQCGAEPSPYAFFCSNCGKPVQESSAPTTAPTEESTETGPVETESVETGPIETEPMDVETEPLQPGELRLSPNNFKEYFSVSITYDDFQQIPVGGKTYFYTYGTVKISPKSNVTAKDVVITGKLHIDVPKTHLLYTEGILPLSVSITLGEGGYGHSRVTYHHSTGSYGGYSFRDDSYFVVESISGTIIFE